MTCSEKAQADYEFIAYALGLIAIATGVVIYFTSGGTIPQLSLNPPTFTPLPPGTTPTPLPPGITPTPLPPGTTPTPLPPGVTPTPLPPGVTPTPYYATSTPSASTTPSPSPTPSLSPTPIAGDSLPLVSSIDPLDNLVSFEPSIYFYCIASDDYRVASISVFTNSTGSWESACSFDGSVAECTINFPAGYYEWDCYAIDNASQGGWSGRRHFEVID